MLTCYRIPSRLRQLATRSAKHESARQQFAERRSCTPRPCTSLLLRYTMVQGTLSGSLIACAPRRPQRGRPRRHELVGFSRTTTLDGGGLDKFCYRVDHVDCLWALSRLVIWISVIDEIPLDLASDRSSYRAANADTARRGDVVVAKRVLNLGEGCATIDRVRAVGVPPASAVKLGRRCQIWLLPASPCH